MFNFLIWPAEKIKLVLGMDREIHDIYDVLLKIVAAVYGTSF